MTFRGERGARFVGLTAPMIVLAVRSVAEAQSPSPEGPGTRERSDSETDELETSEPTALERELYEACPALREFDEKMARVIDARARDPESPRFALDVRLDPLAGHGFRLHLEITADDRTPVVREENERCEPLLELALRHIQQIGVAPVGVSTELLLMPFVVKSSPAASPSGWRLGCEEHPRGAMRSTQTGTAIVYAPAAATACTPPSNAPKNTPAARSSGAIRGSDLAGRFCERGMREGFIFDP